MAELQGELGYQKATSASIDVSSSGDNELIAATAGKSNRVHQIFFTTDTDVDIIFKDGSTALTGAITMYAGGSFVLDYSGFPWFATAQNSAFNLNLSTGAQISGRIYYAQA